MALLDPILGPLLRLPPILAIFLIAATISLAITLVYKYTTDQERMRHLKKKVKSYQEKMRKVRDDPQQLLKLQKEAMSYNMELMKHSFKPTLYTLIPIIIIFGWLNAHMAYMNIAPQEEFTVQAFPRGDGVRISLTTAPPGLELLSDAEQTEGYLWKLKGEAGEYKITLSPEGGDPVEKVVLVTTERAYEPPSATFKEGPIERVVVSNKPVKPLGHISLLGWRPGWLGTYILLSIIMSILFRKLLGVV
ncbi:DUF106 domain-containing protein [Candidatus Woesearchaeota archaeon]|nr:MAG: DUF106 domain-containing protein [Candidatus Woesearchaeota archaeon]